MRGLCDQRRLHDPDCSDLRRKSVLALQIGQSVRRQAFHARAGHMHAARSPVRFGQRNHLREFGDVWADGRWHQGSPAVRPARNLVLANGKMSGIEVSLASLSRQISLVGQASTTIAGGTQSGIHLSAGSLYVRGVNLTGSVSPAIVAGAGSTLVLDHVTVDRNTGGGIYLDGAAFEISDTTVTQNGPAQQGTTVWGGILIDALPTSGAARLERVTISDNQAAGLLCATSGVQGTAVLASGNDTIDVGSGCGTKLDLCSAPSTICGAQP